MNIRKGLSSAGVTIVVVGIGLYASGWPENVRAHPWLLLSILLVGALVSAGSLLFPANRTEATPHSNSVSYENRNIASPVIAPVFNNYLGPSGAPSQLELHSQLPSREPNPLPNLALGFARASVSQQGDFFKFDEHGSRCLTISVTNTPAPHGEAGVEARAIFAQLKFRSDPSSNSTVERAFWIGKDSNQVTLEPGDSSHILVGIPHELSWELFNNLNDYPSSMMEWNQPRHEPESIQYFSINGKVTEVELHIVSKHPSTKHRTISHRRFVIAPNDSNAIPASYRVDWVD
jgi:hypothetical protein